MDGAGTIAGLLKRAKDLGMNALALTDHGNLHGALEFYKTAKDLGINPILGLEAYIAPGSRFHKEDASGSKEASYHLTLLAQDRTGFQNLLKLSSMAFLEGFYFRPRIDKEMLAAHSEGLICLSGCISSELNRGLLIGGDGRHGKGPRSGRLVPQGLRRPLLHRDPEQRPGDAADGHGGGGRPGQPHGPARWSPPATCTTSSARTPRPRTSCSASTRASSAPTPTACGWRPTSSISAARRRCTRVFPGQEEAVQRTQEIADGVDIDLELGKRHFPVYTPPDEKTSEDFLRELCLDGLKERYAGNPERMRRRPACPKR